jgi:hypothetical protein
MKLGADSRSGPGGHAKTRTWKAEANGRESVLWQV